MPSLFHYLKRAPSKLRKLYFAERVERLHIGSGKIRIPGWTNIDNRRLPGVDRVVDVTYGLPFRDVRFIFAEHFVEHLHYGDAMYFLRECRRVLRHDGVLRLSDSESRLGARHALRQRARRRLLPHQSRVPRMGTSVSLQLRSAGGDAAR
ncbi:MAG TPA: methyltransferase domain-containing protein, partial [Thermoanaerobaculia bacterium]